MTPDRIRSLRSVALRTAAFTLLVPTATTILFPWLLLGYGHEIGRFRPMTLPGAVVAGAGVLLYLVCAREFAVAGRGTPAPFDPPRRLVVSGPYRWVRNPIYVGLVLVLLGEALWLGSLALLAYSAFLFLCFHVRVVRWEEPALERTFGEDFRRYRARVGRWIPRRPR